MSEWKQLPKIEDVWGHRTGVASSFRNVYAERLYNYPSGTTSSDNQGNNFLEFEMMQTAILETQFQDMLVNLITYENVPPTFNTLQLETMLRQVGGGVCVGMNDLGELVVLGQSDELGYNNYGNVLPVFMDNNNSMKNRKLITPRNVNTDEGDYVIFYNKQSFTDFYSTDFEIINHYCKLLATIKATERMNLLMFRLPYLIKGKKNGAFSKNFINRYMSGDIFIEIDEAVDIRNFIDKLDLNIPDRTGTCQKSYQNTLSEMITLFGVYNNPEHKKERLVSQEASANNHLIEAMGDIYFAPRRHACDLLNIRYDLDIKVKWNSSVASSFANIASKGGF